MGFSRMFILSATDIITDYIGFFFFEFFGKVHTDIFKVWISSVFDKIATLSEGFGLSSSCLKSLYPMFVL